MKYIAIKPCFIGGTRFKIGDPVNAPEGIKTNCLVPANEYVPVVDKGKKREPSTYSEIARAPVAVAPTTSRGRKYQEQEKEKVEDVEQRASDKKVI